MATEEELKETKRDDSIHTSMDRIDYNLGAGVRKKAYVPKSGVDTPGENEFGDVLERLKKLTGFVPPKKK